MEAGIIYNCLEANEVVSPITFYKGLVKPPIETLEAYKVLEEILLTEGSQTPMLPSSFTKMRIHTKTPT